MQNIITNRSHFHFQCGVLLVNLSTTTPECHGVSLGAASPSLELLAKCDLDSFSSLALPLMSPEQDQLRILAQVGSVSKVYV